MFRFYMPQVSDPAEQIRLLNSQFDAFTNSDALKELFSLLHTDADSFRVDYNARRTADGVRETQVISPSEHLEPLRYQLYPLLAELGFFHINKPLQPAADHILILGGSLNACHLRAKAGVRFITERTISIDALTCFRPINPIERAKSAFTSASDTEFGVMTEAFCNSYDLDASSARDEFAGDRNLNRISCIRTLSAVGADARSGAQSVGPSEDRAYRIFAAPSTQPDIRRADTGDTLLYYLQKTSPSPETSSEDPFDDPFNDSLLAVTHNRYCNRQFLQLAWHLLQYCRERHYAAPSIDVVGLFTDDTIPTADTYDPYQLLQDLIGILDWIDRFRSFAISSVFCDSIC